MKMFKRFIRFYRKHFLQASINLCGLSLGMAVFLAIQMYIQNEQDYDSFWKESERIFRISASWDGTDGVVNKAVVQPPMAPYLRDNAQVEASTRILYWSDFTMRPDNDSSLIFRETNAYIADEQFFKVFRDRLLAGNPETALSVPGTLVLSERAAEKYFGNVPPQSLIGRNILGGKDSGTPWKITGIMKDIPDHSHMAFDIVIGMWDEFRDNDNWSWHVMHTYVRTTTPDRNSLQKDLDRMTNEKLLPLLVRNEFIQNQANNENYRLTAVPLRELHLQPQWDESMRPANREAYLDILNYVSFLVFLLAVINFANISTALSFYRISEIGIRKIHGASRASLYAQLIAEFLIFALVATVIALGINEFFMLGLARYFDVHLHNSPAGVPMFYGGLVLSLIAITLLASAYPAYLLARGKSVRMMKGRFNLGHNKALRSGLISFQFFIAVLLIGFSVTISQQLHYMNERELGFSKDNLLVIQNDREIEEQRDAFVQEINRLEGITSTSFATGIPALPRYHTRDLRKPGETSGHAMQWYEIDEHFMDVLRMELVEGENYRGTDADSGKVILNEAAVKTLQLEAPVGTTLVLNEGAVDEQRLVVSGVVRNFNQEGFRSNVEPLILEPLDNYIFKDYIIVRFEGDNVQKLVDAVNNKWAEFEPQVPMTYTFMSGNFNKLYQSEVMLARVVSIFSLLGLVIAAIGLFGIASVSIEQRTREIGIRKVFGASTSGIIYSQVRKFLLLVIAGLVCAIPLSWFLSIKWLESFVYRTTLSPLSYLYAGTGILLMAALVVGLRVWRTSRMNPITTLRAE